MLDEDKTCEAIFECSITIFFLSDESSLISFTKSLSCFLSGLQKIKTFDDNGQNQEAFRPKHIFHYIQWEDLAPDFIINITGHLDKKMKAIRIFKSQFYNSKSEEPQTPISSLNFIESVESRAKNMGRLINKESGEGFITEGLLAFENFDSLL